ncbi:hypothetical protein [Nonomuraea jabiensis]|uniref:Uncharacterized protein n=1 Tax=Nonomuraea jabiensis TaxID=882448 RepID=A0A7W9G3Z8_9ACTN|nr:hypothetical protein [Nonomuraea jabiensis]MBB5776761.1 hypothetical protein [Nonomuraea jabiensis]
MAAKAYRLLRRTDDRRRRPRHPAQPVPDPRAGGEHAQERPVLTVSQVFELADRIFLTRAAAERALWKMAMEGKADAIQDRGFPCDGTSGHVREPAMR